MYDDKKPSMRGAQGPMAQNRPKSDVLATERAAHEACDSQHSRGSMHGTPLPKPTHQGKDDMATERKGGY